MSTNPYENKNKNKNNNSINHGGISGGTVVVETTDPDGTWNKLRNGSYSWNYIICCTGSNGKLTVLILKTSIRYGHCSF